MNWNVADFSGPKAARFDLHSSLANLSQTSELTNNAIEAARRAGLKPFIKPIRGGPDGSQLTFQGLLTPNLFSGAETFMANWNSIRVGDWKTFLNSGSSPGQIRVYPRKSAADFL